MGYEFTISDLRDKNVGISFCKSLLVNSLPKSGAAGYEKRNARDRNRPKSCNVKR
jgi:hypothetical protein